jgi:hypothetical protein
MSHPQMSHPQKSVPKCHIPKSPSPKVRPQMSHPQKSVPKSPSPNVTSPNVTSPNVRPQTIRRQKTALKNLLRKPRYQRNSGVSNLLRFRHMLKAKVQFVSSSWIFSKMVLFERSNVKECYSVKKNCGMNLSGDVRFFQDVVLYVLL